MAIIGAGPAGLACAKEATDRGARVVVLDEQPQPGGQIYRDIEQLKATRQEDFELLGRDYRDGLSIVESFRRSAADYRSSASVWHVQTEPSKVFFTQDGVSRSLGTRHVVIANGAIERPVPIPGWTLPGVMTAGAAQVLFKSSGIVPEGPVVLAGSGPLLLLVAVQLLAAGVEVRAVAITATLRDCASALRNLPAALLAPEYLTKGAALIATLIRRGVPLHLGAESLAVNGSKEAESLAFECGGSKHEITADIVLLHEGVIPNTQLSRLLGIEHEWVEVQAYWRARHDNFGRTNIPSVSVAGDGGRIGGARAAELEGRLAALGALHALGMIESRALQKVSRPIRWRWRRQQAIRPYLDRLFPPPHSIVQPGDPSIVVCRCSEVTVRDIEHAIRLGCDTPNEVKAASRSGMGPCQGRLCAPVVSAIVANALGSPLSEALYFKVRAPIKPVTLGELAALQGDSSL
jgi:NADPH-dependent 2,4-dienoyl-CoA reductase/sulfur reductase-like enzyme